MLFICHTQLLLLIGTKLEHIINKLAYEVASKHAAGQGGEGGIVVSPSDELFWFHSPRLVLVLIHFILFQNAFEFAYFFWTLVNIWACIWHHACNAISVPNVASYATPSIHLASDH